MKQSVKYALYVHFVKYKSNYDIFNYVRKFSFDTICYVTYIIFCVEVTKYGTTDILVGTCLWCTGCAQNLRFLCTCVVCGLYMNNK